MLKLQPFLEIVIMSAIGAGAAITIDFAVSKHHSLMREASGTLDQISAYFNAPLIPYFLIFLGLVLIGASSVFYLRPLSRKGAFAGGFVTIALLVLLFP